MSWVASLTILLLTIGCCGATEKTIILNIRSRKRINMASGFIRKDGRTNIRKPRGELLGFLFPICFIINRLCPQSILEDVELIHEPAVGDSVVYLLIYR